MKQNTRKLIRFFSVILFLAYILLLSYLLFFSEHYGRIESGDYRYNLELFKEIKRFIVYRHELGWKNLIVNILGNVAAFVPFGFCLPLISGRYAGFFRILFLSAGFSLAVELMQLYSRVGSFDVDDILLNTIGGGLGYIGYAVLYAMYCKKYRKKKRKEQ